MNPTPTQFFKQGKSGFYKSNSLIKYGGLKANNIEARVCEMFFAFFIAFQELILENIHEYWHIYPIFKDKRRYRQFGGGGVS